MGPQAEVTIQRRPHPADDELRAWISVCEYMARQAREKPGVRLVRDEDEVKGGLAECFDELAAFLRDLL